MQKGYKFPPEHCEKMREVALRTYREQPELKQKLSDAAKERYRTNPECWRYDEEFRKICAAGARRAGKAKAPLLSDEQVRYVRDLIEWGFTDKDLATELGVKPMTIWAIRKGRTYRTVK